MRAHVVEHGPQAVFAAGADADGLCAGPGQGHGARRADPRRRAGDERDASRDGIVAVPHRERYLIAMGLTGVPTAFVNGSGDASRKHV